MTALIAAWQAALAAEHEAAFGYTVLGPKLHGANRALAARCGDAHAQLRDRTVAQLVAAGLAPVGPLADYPGIYPVGSPAAARALGIRLENAAAEAWRYLYLVAASTAGPLAARIRPGAQAALTASAVRAAGWRLLVDPAHASDTFPGVGDQ